MKIYSLFTTLFLITACKTLEPLYLSEPIDVGYGQKLDYWSPVKAHGISKEAKTIREKLHKNGGIIFYSYLIDSNGIARKITIERTIPEQLLSSEELVASMLVYPRFKASKSNASKNPVKVHERIVFLNKNKGLLIPPDNLSDAEVVSNYSIW